MSEKEKGEILDSLTNLKPSDKNFILGYMAGRTVETKDDLPKQPETEKE